MPFTDRAAFTNPPPLCPAGGPLLRYVNGKPVLVGIVSYGPDWPCGTAGSVGGYTSVAKMNAWVQRQLARLRV